MKSNWPAKKLGEICNLVKGTEPGSNVYAKKEGDTIQFIRIGDLTGKVDNPKFISKELKDLTIVSANEVLISFDGTPGVVVKGWNGAISSGIRVIRNIKQDEILKDFLFYYLQTPPVQDTIKRYATGITILHASRAIPYIEVSLPPLKIQQKIVERLDAVKKAQELNDKQIELVEELFRSLLSKELNPEGKNWEVKKLGEMCDFYNGQAHEKYINENGNYVVINSKFIASDGMEYKKTNNALFPLLCRDITMVMSDIPKGQALAKCFFVDKNDTYTLNQRICAIRSKNFENKFLYYQLNRNKYFLRFDNGQSQTNLRKNDILSCPLLIPPLEIQKQIVEKLSAVQEYKEKLIEQKQKLQELFESVLNKSMKGELIK